MTDWVNEKALPKDTDAGFWNHDANSVSTFRDIVMCCVLLPFLTSKLKSAPVTRRSTEYPVMTRSRPCGVLTMSMLLICGGAADTSRVATGIPDGPLSMLAVTMTVPTTVPTSTITGDEKTAYVVFAGIENDTTRDPVENCVIGSLTGTSAFELNVSVNWPASTPDRGLSRVISSGSC